MDAARAGQPGPQVAHAHHGRTLQLLLPVAASSSSQRGGDHVGVEDQSAGGGGSDVEYLKKKNVIVVNSIFPQTENKCYIKTLWKIITLLTSFIFLKLPGN